MKKTLAFILGIRPDVIRAALILKYLRSYADIDVSFIWSGQHYSDNLKDIFFRELEIAPAQIDLGCRGNTDAEVVGNVVTRLYQELDTLRPAAAVFLGDTNTTAGSLAAAQLNIPIVHIEGGMRSYDWRMPEEKYRTVIDHLSDVIYVYFDEYRDQAIREGINPRNVVVVGNPIVDILQHYYFARQSHFTGLAAGSFFTDKGLMPDHYFLMTCHRRENVHNPEGLAAIMQLVGAAPYPVYFPASYRTQKILQEQRVATPANLRIVDPVGYDEFLGLLVHSRGVFTDSGTVVEESCILQVPSVQMRRSTERPQTYDVGSSVKFDPADPSAYPYARVLTKLAGLHGARWAQPFGDGRSSQRIADDLHRRLVHNDFRGHKPENYHIPIARSYRDDGLKVGMDI